MKNKTILRVGLLWLEGVILLILRLIQLNSGFDPVTGLSLPSLAGRMVWILLLACLAAEVVMLFRQPKDGKRSFACCFKVLEDAKVPGLLLEGAWVPGLIAASLLMVGGGALLLADALPLQGNQKLVCAVSGLFCIAGGVGFLLLTRKMRGGGTPSVLALVPSMFFSALYLLVVYFPEDHNPVLDRFYLLVLAAALPALFLYQLSAFFQKEGSIRWFGFMADLTVIVCCAAMADCALNSSHARLLINISFAIFASLFLLMLRPEPLPEPEKPASEEKMEEESV